MSTAMEGARDRARRLDGVRVDFENTAWKLNSDGTRQVSHFHYEYEVERARDKLRVMRHRLISPEPDREPIEIFAWDGGKGTGYAEFPSVGPSQRFKGLISADQGAAFVTAWWLTPLEQRVFDMPTTLPELMQSGDWVAVGEDTIDQYRTWILEGTWPKQGDFSPLNSLTRVRVWLAPEHDFAPLRMTYLLRCDGVKDVGGEMSDVHLRRSGGIWVIDHALIEVWNPNLVQEVGAERTIIEYKFKGYETGLEVPDDRFIVKFPIGTSVFDDITKTSFIAGKAIFVRREDGLTDMIAMPEDHELQQWTDPTKGITEHEWQEWWAAVTAPHPTAGSGITRGQRHWLALLTAVVALIVTLVGATVIARLSARRRSA